MKKYFLMLILALFIVVVFGVLGSSFAIFDYNSVGTVSNSLKSGTVDVKFSDDGSMLSLSSSDVLEDTYQFIVVNNGTLSSKYRLTVDDDSCYYNLDSCNKISLLDIKYSLELDGNVIGTGNLGDSIIRSSIINSGETHKYKLKIFTDSILSENFHFYGKVNLDYVVISANFSS